MDDEPAHLARSDVRRGLHRGGAAVQQRERRLRAVDAAIPADRSRVTQREDPLDVAVRAGLRIGRLRLEGRRIGRERRHLERGASEGWRRRRGRHSAEAPVERGPHVALDARQELGRHPDHDRREHADAQAA